MYGGRRGIIITASTQRTTVNELLQLRNDLYSVYMQFRLTNSQLYLAVGLVGLVG